MRFGGHQTFAIRDGWLYKGLRLLSEDPGLLARTEAADTLGVGSNMVKSIRHWLLATGLAERKPDGKRKFVLTVSEFGELVRRYDPFFLHSGTWWALHINLVNSDDCGAAWAWFFNRFAWPRFDRSSCVEGLIRYVQMTEPRRISPRTLRRDIACLLQSYAQVLPPKRVDPEELRECPLVELGLLKRFRDTGSYQLDYGPKPVPPEIVGYAISRPTASDALVREVEDLIELPGGPTRSLVLTGDAFMEVLDHAAAADSRLEVVGLGGRKAVRTAGFSSLDWLRSLYDIGGAASAA